jgi:hypothetical protein
MPDNTSANLVIPRLSLDVVSSPDHSPSHWKDRREVTFILNPIETQLPLPSEVIPDWFLRRALEKEVERMLEFCFSAGFSELRRFDYGEKMPNGQINSPVPETWKFFVLDHKAIAEDNRLLEAANLLENDFAFGPSFGWLNDEHGGRTAGANTTKVAQFFAEPQKRETPVLISEGVVHEWRQLESALRKLTIDELQPYRAFETLRSIPRRSSLYTLGLFATLESIITHAPHDRFDSLRHQVSSKMVLLSKRFIRKLPYKTFGCTEENTWKKLYDYRSCIAHGAQPDLKSGNLGPLKSDETVQEFLREALKLLLIQLLAERPLIEDLKSC